MSAIYWGRQEMIEDDFEYYLSAASEGIAAKDVPFPLPEPADKGRIAGTWVVAYGPTVMFTFPAPSAPALGHDYIPASAIACFKLSADGTLGGLIRLNRGGMGTNLLELEGAFTYGKNFSLGIFEGHMTFVAKAPIPSLPSALGTENIVYFIHTREDELSFILARSRIKFREPELPDDGPHGPDIPFPAPPKVPLSSVVHGTMRRIPSELT